MEQKCAIFAPSAERVLRKPIPIIFDFAGFPVDVASSQSAPFILELGTEQEIELS